MLCFSFSDPFNFWDVIRGENTAIFLNFLYSVWASSPIWPSYPIIWSNKQAPRDHTLVDVSSCLCWMCYTAISSFCLFFIWAWGGSICWKLILSHLVGYWLVINCLFCDLLPSQMAEAGQGEYEGGGGKDRKARTGSMQGYCYSSYGHTCANNHHWFDEDKSLTLFLLLAQDLLSFAFLIWFLWK